MPTQITIEAYSYLELTNHAKERAKETLISYQYSYDTELLEEFKIELNSIGFVNSTINYTGFCSQGDGLSFTCESVDLEKLSAHVDIPHKKLLIPLLHCELERISSRYSHDNTVRVSLGYNNYASLRSPHRTKLNSVTDKIQDNIDQLRRKLCYKFYKKLEENYYSETSDESLSEFAECNDFKFIKTGYLI